MTERAKLAALLAQHAYQEGDFTLTSGAKSTFYLDAKKVTYRPDGAALIGESVLAIMREVGADAVGGMTMGADAIVMSAVCASMETKAPVPGFIVRKQPKGHGTTSSIEGVNPSGRRVAIVDDVITSGGSAIDAAKRAREAGAEVVVVIGVVDREQGGAEKVRAETGAEFRALATLTEIRAAR